MITLAGKPSKFLVATTCPGTGLLTVSIQGPSKVPMSCNELDEGYEFTYTPKAPGQYLIAIKYCHVGIPGSPFQAIVAGELTQTPRQRSPVSQEPRIQTLKQNYA